MGEKPVDTPVDLPDSMNMGNLTRQIRTLAADTAWAGRDADLRETHQAAA